MNDYIIKLVKLNCPLLDISCYIHGGIYTSQVPSESLSFKQYVLRHTESSQHQTGGRQCVLL